MTINRNFKAEVRRRMAQTGERYSTARLHLLNARPEDHAGATGEPILAGYPLRQDPGEHDAALHARALANAGLTDPTSGAPFTEAMLAGLGGGIGFMFATFDYSGLITTTLVTRFHPGPYHQNMRDRAGAESSVSTTTSSAKAAAALDEALDAGRPALCTVGRGALPWHGSSTPIEEAEEYLIAVVGRDADDLLVDDFGVAHRITTDDLAAARAAVRKAKHHLVTVTPGNPIDVEAGIRAAVADTHKLLTSGDAPHGIPTSWAKKFGIAGMSTLAGLMRDHRKAGWAQLFADPANLFTALVRIHECIEVQYSSHGAGRLLYGEFCLEAAERVPSAELARAGAAYLETGQAWAELADAALPDSDRYLNRARQLCVARQSAVVSGGDPRAAVVALDELRDTFVEADGWDFDDRLAHFVTLADQLDAIAARETNAAAHLKAFLDHG
ncbi:MAG: BtrH N-terminal domain-containing protein [Acidimicrobiales bacterium]